jgi:hypothetical protein
MAAGAEDMRLAVINRGARRMVGMLLAADVALIAAFLILFLSGHGIEVLAIGLERSIPNWYSAAKLLILAQLLAFVAWRASAETWQETLILLAPALLFMLMSVEEVASIRDRLERVLAPADEGEARAQVMQAGTLLSGIVLALALTGIGTAYARIVTVPTAILAKAVSGAIIFLLGAVGVELLFDEPGKQAVRILPAAAEEGAELVGVTLMIWAASGLAMPYLRALLWSPAARTI